MYRVMFNDSVHGTQCEEFEEFEMAAEYWNEYADTPTCTAGSLTDLEKSSGSLARKSKRGNKNPALPIGGKK